MKWLDNFMLGKGWEEDVKARLDEADEVFTELSSAAKILGVDAVQYVDDNELVMVRAINALAKRMKTLEDK